MSNQQPGPPPPSSGGNPPGEPEAENRERGSRRHVLNLAASPRFHELMNGILAETGVSLAESDVHQPGGPDNPSEWTIRRFAETHLARWQEFGFADFDAWWVSDQYRNPQWDLLTTCRIQGVRGLLICVT